MIQNIIKFFSGKKSYIVGALTIVLGFLNWDITMVMTGLGIMTLRAGIAKTG